MDDKTFENYKEDILQGIIDNVNERKEIERLERQLIKLDVQIEDLNGQKNEIYSKLEAFTERSTPLHEVFMRYYEELEG